MNSDTLTGEARVARTLRNAGKWPTEGDFSDRIDAILASGADSFFTAGSPLGTVYVGLGAMGVRHLTPRAGNDEEFVRNYGEMFGRLVVPAKGDELEESRDLVERALAGEKVEVPVDLSGRTGFQRRVLEVVGGIPRGEVRPYSWVAGEAGSPRASRAVGTVMANNPIPLIVPCHRVIRNDGSPGNYGFDPRQKVRLLEGEGVPVKEISRAPYIATPTTGIVCHATCHNAKRIRPANRREFKSVSPALDAGFRPCRVCRPAVAA